MSPPHTQCVRGGGAQPQPRRPHAVFSVPLLAPFCSPGSSSELGFPRPRGFRAHTHHSRAGVSTCSPKHRIRLCRRLFPVRGRLWPCIMSSREEGVFNLVQGHHLSAGQSRDHWSLCPLGPCPSTLRKAGRVSASGHRHYPNPSLWQPWLLPASPQRPLIGVQSVFADAAQTAVPLGTVWHSS